MAGLTDRHASLALSRWDDVRTAHGVGSSWEQALIRDAMSHLDGTDSVIVNSRPVERAAVAIEPKILQQSSWLRRS